MEDLNVVNSINDIGTWLLKNKNLLIQYSINIFLSTIILIIGSFISKVISNTFNRIIKSNGIDATISDFLSAIIRYILFIFTFITILGRIGVKTSSVITVLSAAGLAVALALQGSLSNFAAGVLLVVFRPLKVGEYVDLCGVVGTVDQVHIFTTTLRSADNKIIVVPNGKIIANNIINYSRELNRRVDIEVGIVCNADINMVKKNLIKIISSDRRIIYRKGITVRLKEVTPDSLIFIVHVWTTNSNYWEVYFDLIENFKYSLDVNNIGISIS